MNTESLPIAWREYCKTYGSLNAKRIEGIGLSFGIAFCAVWIFFSLFFGVRHKRNNACRFGGDRCGVYFGKVPA